MHKVETQKNVSGSLEALTEAVEAARIEYVEAYWQELVYQHGGGDIGKTTRSIRKEIAGSRAKSKKKEAAEGPLILVDEDRARGGYREAKREYEDAVARYLGSVGGQGDAQSVLDAELAEQTKLASQIETKILRRGFRKSMEHVKGFAIFCARGIAEARKKRLFQKTEEWFRKHRHIGAFLAALPVAALIIMFPLLGAFFAGAVVGVGVRLSMGKSVEKYFEFLSKLGSLKEIDEKLNESWAQAKSQGIFYAEWRKKNRKLINHRAKVARRAQQVGMAVGLTAGVATFIVTGHGVGWNIMHHGAGFDAADLSLFSTSVAAAESGGAGKPAVGGTPIEDSSAPRGTAEPLTGETYSEVGFLIERYDRLFKLWREFMDRAERLFDSYPQGHPMRETIWLLQMDVLELHSALPAELEELKNMRSWMAMIERSEELAKDPSISDRDLKYTYGAIARSDIPRFRAEVGGRIKALTASINAKLDTLDSIYRNVGVGPGATARILPGPLATGEPLAFVQMAAETNGVGSEGDYGREEQGNEARFIPLSYPPPDALPDTEPLDKGFSGVGDEIRPRSLFAAYANEYNQLIFWERKFISDIQYLQSLLGPSDDEFLNRVYQNYTLAKEYAVEDFRRLANPEYRATLTPEKLLALEQSLRRNLDIMKLCQSYIEGEVDRARDDPTGFKKFGLKRIKIAAPLGAEFQVAAASTVVSDSPYGRGPGTPIELAQADRPLLIPSDDARFGARPDDPPLLKGELTLENLLAEIERLTEFKRTRIDPLVRKLLAIGGPSDPAYIAALRIQQGYEELIQQLNGLRDDFVNLENARKRILAGQPDMYRKYRFGAKEWELRDLLRKTNLSSLRAMDENVSVLEDLVKQGKPGQVLVDGKWMFLADEVAFKDAGGDLVSPELGRGIRDFVSMLHLFGWILEGENYDGKLDGVVVTEGGEAKRVDHAEGSRHMGPNASAYDLRCSRDPARVAYMLAVDQLVDSVYAKFEIDGSAADLAKLRKAVRGVLLDPNGPYVKPPFNMTPEKVDKIISNQIGVNKAAQARDAVRGTNNHADHFHVELTKKPSPTSIRA